MSQADFQAANPYASFGHIAADAPATERAGFIKRTYMHLMLAVYALVVLDFIWLQVIPGEWISRLLQFRFGWLAVIGMFMLVSYVADKWARSNTSIGLQYAGLGLYVLAESLILVPLLWLGTQVTLNTSMGPMNPIAVAAVATLVIFAVLTAIVFATGKDFSFMRSALMLVGMGAVILVFASALLGFHLGMWFSVAMVVFAGCAILYDTSNILHHYRTTQHVAASLALFASVALLFWYILQIVISFSSSD